MKFFILIVFTASLLSGCASTSAQISEQQTIAEIDSELVPLDIQNQNLGEARLHLNEALALAPNNPKVLVAAGYFDFKMGDFTNAQSNYQTAVLKAPNDAAILNDYGVYLYQQGKYAKALSYFLMAAKNPQNSAFDEASANLKLAKIKLQAGS